MNKKPHPLAGNKHAVKSDNGEATSHIHARCTPKDKAGWVKAAQGEGLKLTEWIIKTLNKEVNEKS